MLSFMVSLLAFLVAITVLVAIHEFGHFYVARLCGVKVLRFSVGFGRKLASWRDKKGTEYWLSALPLGGYVKMLDTREGEVAEAELPYAFNRQSVGKRIAIVAAGPLINFLFAIIAYWLSFMIGTAALAPILGEVSPGSAAAQAGLSGGEEIVAVDGHATESWQALRLAALRRIGEVDKTMMVTVKDALGDEHVREVKLTAWHDGGGDEISLLSLGIVPYQVEVDMVLDSVLAGGAADSAGLLPGDELLAIEGQPIMDWQALLKIIQANGGQPLALEIRRDGQSQTVTVTPELKKNAAGKMVGMIGVVAKSKAMPDNLVRTVSYGFLPALWQACQQTWQVTLLTLSIIGKMLMGLVSTQSLSGPVGIAKMAGATVSYGFVYYLGFLALLSVSLGVLNFLPVPLLDGGHLFYYMLEILRGKPVSEQAQATAAKVGFILLVALMVLALYNDLSKMLH